MKSALHYLMAARRSEILELRQLALTSALVNATGRLIHALQLERGMSNLFLASAGAEYGGERNRQIQASRLAQAQLHESFDELDTDPAQVGNGARLFSGMALVLQGLDSLPGLREQVGALRLSPAQATQAYARLIAALLAVVFEAADGATDPQISRLLVARFNLMQGKEFTGQERALGSVLWSSGRAVAADQSRLMRLVESQERCFQVFADFATEGPARAWALAQTSPALAEVERLRRVLVTLPEGARLDASLALTWFACCTRRMEDMKRIEDDMAAELLRACQAQIAQARADLAQLQTLADQGASGGAVAGAGQASALDAGTAQADQRAAALSGRAQPAALGSAMERAVLDLVQQQAQRLQAMRDELDTARASLNERKLIERAKGLLMAHRQLSEDEAHKAMRQMAMNQNRRLIDVAQALLSMAEVLPAGNARPRSAAARTVDPSSTQATSQP